MPVTASQCLGLRCLWCCFVSTQYAPASCTPDAAAQLQPIPYACGAEHALLPVAVGATNIHEPLRLGDATITASDHVRLLGVTISSDLSPVKHVGTISLSCFYWLHQIRRIRRSLDAESAKTLVHAFITSHIDGCNTMLAGSPRTITDRLQRLLNAAAHVISNTGKFDRGLTHLLHSELHWLNVPQRILHKLGVTVHRCLQGRAP